MYGINDRNRGMVAAALRLAADRDAGFGSESQRTLHAIAEQIEARPVALEDRRYGLVGFENLASLTASQVLGVGWPAGMHEEAEKRLADLEVGESLMDADRDAWRRTV